LGRPENIELFNEMPARDILLVHGQVDQCISYRT